VKRAALETAPLGERGRIVAVSAEEMREIDRRTIAGGVPGEVLMERAGAGAVEVLGESFGREARRGVVLVAGKGNNGGDALVMARLLRRRRIRCEVFLAARRGDLAGDAALNLKRLEKAGGRVRELGRVGLGSLAEAAAKAGVLVDGLFGTGLRGALGEPAQAIVECMNAAPCAILAVDVPSGLDADRGVVLGAAVQATATATFAFPKLGCLVHPGAELSGELVVVDIGVSRAAVVEVAPKGRLLTPAAVAIALPPRAPDTHKGTFGHLLVLAGSRGKSGAAILCGRASLRAGSGLTTVAGPAVEGLVAAAPEVMTESLAGDDGAWTFSSAASSEIRRALEGKDAAVLGPGIGATPATRGLTEWLIASSPAPLVIDADGLNCLAGQIGWLRRKRFPIVLTPHPGEMARLSSVTTGEVQADRIGEARRLAAGYDVVIVLKGARTVIAAPDGRVSINPTGNPGMASGGMGDALAGIVGSLLAQGIDAFEAAEVATFWHGHAADRVAARRGEAGLTASDVIDELPSALAELQQRL
jgi:NAD(P)H-hydrate epimerase